MHWLRIHFPGGKQDRQFAIPPAAGDRINITYQDELVELVVKNLSFDEDDTSELRCSVFCEKAKVLA